MPIDASIALQTRPIQLESPLNQYANVMAIQGAQSQNRLSNLQYDQALKAQREDEDTKAAIASSGGDLTAARNALMNRGLYKPAMALDKSALETRKATAEITEKDIKAAKDRLEAFSGLLAPVASKPNVTHDDILAIGNRAQAMGLLPAGWQTSVPMNAMQLPSFVQSLVMSTEQGRKALEMLTPRVSMQDLGGAVQPMNTNPLAGAIGPLAGAQPLTKTNTPGEILTDERTRSEGEKGREVTREAQRITVRGQNMTDARAREANALGGRTFDSERGMVINTRTGEATPVTAGGQPITPKDNAPEAMLKAAGYADRMKKAAQYLDRFEASGKPGLLESAAGAIPKIAGGNVAENLARGTDRQQYHQAAEDWVRAKLRQESGAVIADEEMAREIRTYFPQIGDKPEVIAQKKKARETAEKAMVTAAGRAIRPGDRAAAPVTPSPTQTDFAGMSNTELAKRLGL